MYSFKLLALLLTTAVALPTTPVSTELHVRQADGATCGSNTYSADDISSAQNAGYNYLEEGQTVGDDSYPHEYHDYEGFDFTVSSPWYEFPILASGEIFDGSTGPGADRVVFNEDNELAGVITHTGASGDDFVLCDYN